MPFYEYQCSACGRVSEVMQKISDPPLKKCPNCGKAKLTRLVSAPVFRLKGSGWYETDFKGDSDRKRNLAGGEAEPAAKPDAEAKPDKAESPGDKQGDKKGDAKSDAPAKPVEKKAESNAAASRSASKNRPAAKPVKRSVAKKAPVKKARR